MEEDTQDNNNEEEKMDAWETYLAEIDKNNRTVVPIEVRKAVGLGHGDLVRIRIQKVKENAE